MKDDDPEKRIRELERELADLGPARHEQPREARPYPSDAAYVGGSAYDRGLATPRRKVPVLWWFPAVLVAIFVVAALAAIYIANQLSGGGGSTGGGSGGGPITLSQGGTLDVPGNAINETIACNDGNLTLSAINSTINVSGHCVSLKVSGFDDHVNVDSADTIEVSGYGNTFSAGGHSANVKISSYGNHVNVGSTETITVSAYNNQVHVDSADTINVAGYSNTVSYKSGSPKVTQSGYDITVKQG